MLKKLLRAFGTLAVVGVLVYQNFFQYGSKIDFGNDHTVYYTSGATKEDAQKVGDSLKTLGYFDGGGAAVQVAKDGETYVVRFVTIDSAWTDKEMQKNFSTVGYFIKEGSFPGKSLRVELCDDQIKPKVTLTPEAPPEEPAAEEPAAEVRSDEAPSE